MKPLADAFIRLIQMVIGPIIFCTVVHGIAGAPDMKSVGRIAIKALIYFEIVTTIALVIGMVVGNVWQAGVGMHLNPALLDASAVNAYTSCAWRQRPLKARSTFSSTSFRPPLWTASPRATSCKCCSSRSCSGSA